MRVAIHTFYHHPIGAFPMRRLFSLLAIALLAAPVHAQEKKADLTGKWLFSVQTDAGTGTPTVTLKQSGDSLSGHYSSAQLGEADLKGTIKDQKFSFRINVDAGGTQLVVTYSGQTDGDNGLKGSVDLGGVGSGTFTAKRQP
jgi:hypothetical protein